MPGPQMAVLVKGVPDFREGKVKFKEDNTLDRGSTPTVLNPNDKLALEAAREVQVKHGGTAHILCMGPPNYRTILAEAMQTCGDHLYLLSDVKFAGADTLATANALVSAIRKIGGIELIFAGFKTADGETGQTGPQASVILDWPILTHVTNLGLDPAARVVRASRFVYDEREECEAPMPAFIVTDPGFATSYRRATDRLRLLQHIETQKARHASYERYLQVWNAAACGAPEDKIGLRGSPTIVRMVEPIPKAPSERTARVIRARDPGAIDELAGLILQKVAP